MVQMITSVVSLLTPLLVAVITAYSAVLVAKINKVQKDVKSNISQVKNVQRDITTNHGSLHLGDAIDHITHKINLMADNQKILITRIHTIQELGAALEHRVTTLETQTPYQSPPDTVELPIPSMKGTPNG